MKKPMMALMCAIAAALFPPVSAGQGAEASATDYRIEEVIVSARKQEESLQSVPVAVSALSGEALYQRNSLDIGELEGIAPNVSFGRHGSFPASAQITIRGMTSMDIERSFDPSVGVSVDGVFTATNTNQMLDLFDVERVEVLRGPQGTLFGRNTIGGTVNAIRKKASTDALDAGLELVGGNYKRIEARGYLNAPVTDTLAARVSLFSRDQDGYVDNHFDPSVRDGDKRLGIDSKAARVNLEWRPAESLHVAFNYDWLKDRSDAGYAINITDPNGYDTGTRQAPYVWCQLQNPCNGKPSDIYKIEADQLNIADIDRDSYILQIDYDFNDNMTLTYLGSYAEQDEALWLDWDGVGDAIIGYNETTGQAINGTFFHSDDRAQNETVASHELRITGNLMDRLDIVAGVYLYAMEYELTQINVFTGLPLKIDATQKAESRAVFAQGNYSFNAAWRVTLGVRYTEDEKTFSRGMELFGNTLFRVNNLEDDWGEATYRVGGDYQLNKDLMLYASYATGYKAGGFNGRAGSAEVARVSYDPETVNTFETGMKSEWLDQRLRVNATLFSSKYDDLQVDVNVPAEAGQNLFITNAASASSEGLELEVLALLTPGTRLTLNYGYLNADYDEFDANLFGETDENGALIITNYSGNALRRSPKNQLYIGLAQDWELPKGLLTGDASYRWKDRQETTIDNDDWLAIEDYGVLDFNLTYQHDTRWRISAFVHNVTDEDVLGYALRVSNLWQFATPETRPRTYGVAMAYTL